MSDRSFGFDMLGLGAGLACVIFAASYAIAQTHPALVCMHAGGTWAHEQHHPSPEAGTCTPKTTP